MRRIFIGDIQGCREELESLLAELNYDPASDALHPVGDLVNRGPDSLGTLELLISLEAQPVLGNHDLHFLRTARGTRRLGRRDTLSDCLASDRLETLVAWLAAQPFVRVFDDLYAVHAGLHPAWQHPGELLAGIDPFLQDPCTDFATRVRWCNADGERPKPDRDPPLGAAGVTGSSADEDSADPHSDPGTTAAGAFRPWHDFYQSEEHGGRTVVFGHWAKRGLVQRAGVRGLDTGCVWGGALTAWIAEEDRFISTPARRTYCSVED